MKAYLGARTHLANSVEAFVKGFDVLKITPVEYKEIPADPQQALQYAYWMTLEARKALAAGRTPVVIDLLGKVQALVRRDDVWEAVKEASNKS